MSTGKGDAETFPIPVFMYRIHFWGQSQCVYLLWQADQWGVSYHRMTAA